MGGNGLDPVGAYGWGGAYGSVYRVDPTARLVMTLMLNQIPNATDLRTKFQTLVHQAVVPSEDLGPGSWVLGLGAEVLT